MIQVDKQALREAALNAKIAGEAPVMPFDKRIDALNAFTKLLTPVTTIALLDENEALERRVEELAAENAALKNYQPSPTSAAVFEAIEITESLFDEGRPELAMIKAFNIMKMKRSPNTDTFINDMRAQGVEMLADLLSGMNISVSETSVREFAKNLREGNA
ncbi:hypothetical protein [Edwardsiella phage GF-2]|uniref:Uncharacterized protein n=1 Tax=Edwardsiella phage GF-2 TaxID=1537091 RepID=A0A077KGY1_9CAUD|nr:hypothetical protein VC56_gp44 [Edwardsiella phage GF-2]BAP28915.1 hypothetical protein [Edwardsiella phage GF-2]